MNSDMKWELHIAGPARKSLKRFQPQDRERILAVLEAMRGDPFRGDVARLKNQPADWRRRVGGFRIFFNTYSDRLLVVVVAILRRTSKTY